MENSESHKSPEQPAIFTRKAEIEDLQNIEDFLQRPDIDSLFVPPLSDPARNITIRERVEKKFKNGTWLIAVLNNRIIGCLAVIPATLAKETVMPLEEGYVFKSVSIAPWGKTKFWELSTVVVDLPFLKKENIKGTGGSLYELAKQWVQSQGPENGLITDSWVGGDMGGFVHAMNTKAYRSQKEDETEAPDTILQIYSDPAKRGKNGPLTVIYGIPIDEKDWSFFESAKMEVKQLRQEYEKIKPQ